MQPFVPLIAHPHLSTILAHFWPAGLNEQRYPVERRLYATEPGVQVLVDTQQPEGERAGDIVLVHGLEGSSRAGYMLSMARTALQAGYAVHRLNLRTCGGTEEHSETPYHSGMTADLLAVLRRLEAEGRGPRHVVGYSLGGNIALKLAGELSENARGFIASVCGVSTPIDLSACTRCMEKRENRIYELRFLKRLKRRVRTLSRLRPGSYPTEGLDAVTSIRGFDDRFTAAWFGFKGAEDYYQTQSSLQFLPAVRVPTLIVQAKDDPVIPFPIFESPEVRTNPSIELIAADHGGHLGFLARRTPRFWSDTVVIEWIEKHRAG